MRMDRFCAVALVTVITLATYVSRGGMPYSGEMPETRGLQLAGASKLMPRVGFGTCCRKSSKGQPLIDSTLSYLSQGGRLIDTAQMYENHADLAVAIRRSGVPRSDLWVTSKVRTLRGDGSEFTGSHRTAVTMEVEKILVELDLTQLDLLLLHHAKGNTAAERADEWRGLLDSKAQGQVVNVGVSNYDVPQLEALRDATGVLPAVNQLEYHPWIPEHDAIVQWCKSNGVGVIAYGSLGSSNNRASAGAGVAAVAARHGASSAQVLLRWALQRGVAVIPGATSAGHIRENLHLPPFVLSADDEREIAGDTRPASWRAWSNMGGRAS